jgi:isoamylase
MSVWAPHATGIDLCLFDASGEETRFPLIGPEAGLWHGVVLGVKVGQRYGLRAHGPWNPSQGHLFNPAKLLLDPYARGLDGVLADSSHEGFEATLSNVDEVDSAPFVPKGVLVGPPRNASLRSPIIASRAITTSVTTTPPAPPPRTRWRDTVIYEAHVKGLTQRMPGVPPRLRGTYAALGHDAVIRYLSNLGITALELLPIHAYASERHLERESLTNYWGYNTLAFFAPHPAYATVAAQRVGPQAILDELRDAISRLHKAGIEVILDVVYNHTCEGGIGGRQVSWRGLANRSYYRHRDGEPGVLDDTTGTGNTLDFGQMGTVKMALDSLRYWASEVGVDGFRFDLAATLGRMGNGFDARHPFPVGLVTDPIISATKLVAEPWDIGFGGWQTGAFPEPMAEWNDRFRDSVRSFWLSDADRAVHKKSTPGVRDLATRLAGSSDVFGNGDPPLSRGCVASINFVTAHDGFTLADLASYSRKQNKANGEGGNDGAVNNLSWNHGVEGPSKDARVLKARRRSARNLLGTLLLSAGVPMITAGDEIGRTQGGNNNAYSQDNETSWLDWAAAKNSEDLRATVSYLIRLRRENLVLRPTTFYEGRDRDLTRRDDLAWFTADGQPESEGWWHDSSVRALQMMRSLSEGPDALLVINGYGSDASVTIPVDNGPPWVMAWNSVWESPVTAEAQAARTREPLPPGGTISVPSLSMQLFLSV